MWIKNNLEKQRLAEETLGWAKSLLAAYGDEIGVARIGDYVTIASDEKLLGGGTITLTIHVDDRLVLTAIWDDNPDFRPFFTVFKCDPWRHILRRAVNKLLEAA